MKTRNIKLYIITLLVEIASGFLAVLALNGCKSARYVSSESKDTLSTTSLSYDSTKWDRLVSDSTLYIYKVKNDTIIKDSVYVLEHADGTRDTYNTHKEKIVSIVRDTIYKKTVDTSALESYKSKLDSVYKSKVDTISTTTYKEKDLSNMQSLFLGIGKLTCLSLLAALLLGGFFIYKKYFS